MRAGHGAIRRTREAAEAFVESNREYAFRLALQFLGSREHAEDVAQEALVRAYRGYPKLRTEDNERAWLRQIVVRRALSHLKSHKCPAEEREVPHESDPVQDLAVRETLEKLSPEHQIILALAIGERLSYEEIADALSIPSGTVGSRVHAAKAAFRKRWECTP